MNERRSIEKQPQLELPKEMGFQSYELIAGDGIWRNAQKQVFLSGRVRNPTLDYPNLDENKLEASIRKLEPVLDAAQQYDDETLGDVVWNSASYRMAEMYWLLEAKRLNELSKNPESEEFKRSAIRYQTVNEQLYGKPDEATKEAVYGEIMAQVSDKELHTSARKIYKELIDGMVVELENEELFVPGIGDNHPTRLPKDSKERLIELKEVLEEKFPDAIRIVTENWQNKIAMNVSLSKSEEQDCFTVDDMKTVFEQVRDFYDPTNEAGIDVVIDPNSTGLAWDTPSMSVKIGGRRSNIKRLSEMVALVIHEYGNHGYRAVSGKKTGVPSLGTGMYSDAVEGERSDYLTFEEGFATLCGMSIDGQTSEWTPAFLNYYFAISSAYEGCDFRQTYERMWRMAVLLNIKSNEEPTDEVIGRIKKSAYTACVRVFRGTPTQLADGPVLTFNKDLAYLNGKLDGLRYLEEHKGDKNAINRLFLGKFDPNNHIQNSIVEQYVENV